MESSHGFHPSSRSIITLHESNLKPHTTSSPFHSAQCQIQSKLRCSGISGESKRRLGNAFTERSDLISKSMQSYLSIPIYIYEYVWVENLHLRIYIWRKIRRREALIWRAIFTLSHLSVYLFVIYHERSYLNAIPIHIYPISVVVVSGNSNMSIKALGGSACRH